MGVSTLTLIVIFWMGYSLNTCGIFVGYSWGIRMYRVCVGYVSGMYRECIETSEVRKWFFDNLVEKLKKNARECAKENVCLLRKPFALTV